MGTPVTLETALHLRNHHLSIIPTRPDGTKAPPQPRQANPTAPPPQADNERRKGQSPPQPNPGRHTKPPPHPWQKSTNGTRTATSATSASPSSPAKPPTASK